MRSSTKSKEIARKWKANITEAALENRYCASVADLLGISMDRCIAGPGKRWREAILAAPAEKFEKAVMNIIDDSSAE